jgi:hypothetical protein
MPGNPNCEKRTHQCCQVNSSLSRQRRRTRGNRTSKPAAEDQARKELGYTYEFVELGGIATFDGLTRALAIEEQLFAMLDKCLKRLLLVRGLKSISGTSSSGPRRELQGPRKPRDRQPT